MYVGLEIQKKTCYGTVMTYDREVVKRSRFPNDVEGGCWGTWGDREEQPHRGGELHEGLDAPRP